MIKRIISLLLVFTSIFSAFVINASASDGEEFISEVALIYEDSVEDALEEIKGTDWKLFEQDLNANADVVFDDGVYLIYKTTTNVEEAITDLRVMDMYGGYSSTDYKKQLEATRAAYTKLVGYVRTAANEFKTLYLAGDRMAELAYRQMNYYKDIGESELLMGDFLLNIPSDEALVTVMMEGSYYVYFNLLSLLAIGISGDGEEVLAKRIAEMYQIKDTLTDKDYYDAASTLSDKFMEIRASILRYEALKSEYDITDEEMTEEEYEFVSTYATTALTLEQISYGDMTLKDFLSTTDWTIQDLYPIVAALSEGQRALTELGLFTTVLQYSAPSKPIDDLIALIEENEASMKDDKGQIKPYDVYMGVDRSIYDGVFAFTSNAERQQALTGIEWTRDYYLDNEAANNIPWAACGTIAGAGVLVGLAPVALLPTISAVWKISAFFSPTVTAAGKVVSGFFTRACQDAWVGTYRLFVGTNVPPYFYGAGVALILIAAGIAGISVWYGYYNPDYTPIPDNMIDVKETDLGDRYIKYTAAKVFDDGELSEKNADFNAYEGKEWIALYYTKDATAGKCLIPNFVCKDNDSSVARRHQGISMFGETKAFNLNSHVFGKNAPGVYVTIRYSTTKKAAAELPSVVGSMFATGMLYAVTAVGGVSVGAAATLFIQKASAKKKKEPEEELPRES